MLSPSWGGGDRREGRQGVLPGYSGWDRANVRPQTLPSNWHLALPLHTRPGLILASQHAVLGACLPTPPHGQDGGHSQVLPPGRTRQCGHPNPKTCPLDPPSSSFSDGRVSDVQASEPGVQGPQLPTTSMILGKLLSLPGSVRALYEMGAQPRSPLAQAQMPCVSVKQAWNKETSHLPYHFSLPPLISGQQSPPPLATPQFCSIALSCQETPFLFLWSH